MRPLAKPLAALLLLAALASSAAAQLTVKPAAGKFLGYAAAEQPGKWLVFGPDGLKPVQPTILEAGKAAMWEGDAGQYAVILIPPADDAQPIVTVVDLGKAPTPPPGPDPPPPGPDPPKPDNFSAKIRAARDLVDQAHRGAASQLADIFTAVASEAAANPSAWDPAAMANEVKVRATSAMTAEQLAAWRPWWAAYAKAMVELKLTDGDLPGHVAAFQMVAAALT